MRISVDAATTQILRESGEGSVSRNVEDAVRVWVSCECSVNIRKGVCELCDFCKIKAAGDIKEMRSP